MGREDPDVVEEMQRILGEEGIRFIVSAQPLEVRGRSGREVSLTVRVGSGEQKIESSHLLVAAGRVANTAGVGLAEAGVELDDRGFVRVNDRLQTTAPGGMGDWRMRRQPAIHACVCRRLCDFA